MKLKLPVLSLLTTLSPLAIAQSSLTLYGSMDVHVAHQRAGGRGHQTVLGSGLSPNAFGLRGIEDLGGRLRAGFVLEGQPALDTGSFGQGGKVFGRQSAVYLESDWGRMSLGRLHTPGRAFGVKYSSTGWLTTDPFASAAFGIGSGLSPATNADGLGSRFSNALAYESPKLGAFRFTLYHALGEGGAVANGSAKVTTVGLTYSNGALDVDVVLIDMPKLANRQSRQKDYAIGASYALGFGKLFVATLGKRSAVVSTVGGTAELPGSEATDRSHILGVSVPVGGAGSFAAAVGRIDIADVHRGQVASNMGAPFGAALDDGTAWSVAYTHKLSKRTSLFAAYGTLDNDAQGTGSLAPGLRPMAGGSSSLLAAGIRHSF